MDEFYLALCSCGEPVVPKGKSRGKSCRFPSSPPYQLASWTGWGTHAVPRECVAGGCIRGASGEPVGPRRGRCSGMQDFIWALLGALPHRYNDPLISADLIKGLLLTGGWGVPRASGAAGLPRSLLWEWVTRLRRGRQEVTAMPCPEEGVIL